MDIKEAIEVTKDFIKDNNAFWSKTGDDPRYNALQTLISLAERVDEGKIGEIIRNCPSSDWLRGYFEGNREVKIIAYFDDLAKAIVKELGGE